MYAHFQVSKSVQWVCTIIFRNAFLYEIKHWRFVYRQILNIKIVSKMSNEYNFHTKNKIYTVKIVLVHFFRELAFEKVKKNWPHTKHQIKGTYFIFIMWTFDIDIPLWFKSSTRSKKVYPRFFAFRVFGKCDLQIKFVIPSLPSETRPFFVVWCLFFFFGISN